MFGMGHERETHAPTARAARITSGRIRVQRLEAIYFPEHALLPAINFRSNKPIKNGTVDADRPATCHGCHGLQQAHTGQTAAFESGIPR